MNIFKKTIIALLTITILFTVGCASEATAETNKNNVTTQQTEATQLSANNQTKSSGESPILSLLDEYIDSGILTQGEAEELAAFLIENRPNAQSRQQDGINQQQPQSGNGQRPQQGENNQGFQQGNKGQQPPNQINNEDGEKPNPLLDAVEAKIITNQQAEDLKGVLMQLGQSNQGSAMQENPGNGESMQNQNQGDSGQSGSKLSFVTSLSVSDANQIADELIADVGYTSKAGGYPIVDTDITDYYNNTSKITAPSEGQDFYGQDANYTGNIASYTDNGDGTVTDNITGLMWQQDPGEKMTWIEAVDNLDSFNLGGYEDWRLPSVKELYSLVQFSGITATSAQNSVPYIDTDYFVFSYGDEDNDERMIDSQMATSTIYDASTMNGNSTMFGFNFADGRIKGYPTSKEFYVYYVRGNTSYGQNLLIDNGDGTISDLSTGLMWMIDDSAAFNAGDAGDGSMDWGDSLEWCENLEFAGYDDWKLPDAKELQSIVDYTRSPDTTNSAAIDEMFNASQVINCFGEQDYGYYWTSTTHLDGRNYGSKAVYVAFGRGNGQINGQDMDVHGAGCQRSDSKTGDRDDYPSIFSHAPQGDENRVFNLVRAVRVIGE